VATAVLVILLMPIDRVGYFFFSDSDYKDFGDSNDERN
jgi:hypothetical protein